MFPERLSSADWRKSSRSGGQGACVEAVTLWRKSTRSSGTGQCLEAASSQSRIAVRDSKRPDGPMLMFSEHAWRSFMVQMKGGLHLHRQSGGVG